MDASDALASLLASMQHHVERQRLEDAARRVVIGCRLGFESVEAMDRHLNELDAASAALRAVVKAKKAPA